MYSFTLEGAELRARVRAYLDEFAYPRQDEYRAQREEVGPNGYVPLLDELKAAARSRGLWNLFLPHLAPDAPGTRLSNVDYAPISEDLGKIPFASEALNCSAPDSGNMEILNLYGSERVKKEWLAPLLDGEIRSAFSMTEPAAASSDAANIALRIERDGDTYVLNGTQVVHLLRPRRALPGAGRDGEDEPRRVAAPPAFDGRGAAGHPRRDLRPHPPRIRLRRAGRPSRDPLPTTSASPPTTCWGRRAADSPSPRPGSDPAASTTACAPSGRPNWPWTT